MKPLLPRLVGLVALAIWVCLAPASRAFAQVKTVAELVSAVNNGQVNAEVVVGAGTFELTGPLRPKMGMKIKGAGAGMTTIRNAASWAPGNAGLDKDEGATRTAIQCDSYLFSLAANATDVSILDMTLTGPQVHGAICGMGIHRLELARLEIRSFLWAGLRSFGMDGARIFDNAFFDAGNKSMVTTGSSGGGLFLTYTEDAEIRDNRFKRSVGNDYYGIKGREARNVHIFNNTIETDFAIEFPFENDHFVQIDHNYLGGTISIPKHSGGTFPAGGHAFHVHHNYFKTSYSFEFHRNGLEIDHNLFDFAVNADGGNLISGFDVSAAPGATKMHNNLIRNPGRGIYWNEGVYNNFSFTNNHVKGETTVTPRTEGLFDFRPARSGAVTDWKTIVIRDNIFELTGTTRPLMRNAESHAAVIENNTLKNLKDTASYANPDTGNPKGPTEKLSFRLGAQGEWTVDGWTVSRTIDAPPGSGGTGGLGGEGGANAGGGGGGPSTGTSGDGGNAAGESGQAGEPGQGGGSDQGGGGGDDPGSSNGSSGCGCRLSSNADAGGGALLVLGAALWFAMRRRRRSLERRSH